MITELLNDKPWYAVQVRPRHEKVVTKMLHIRGIEPFLPLYRARHRWSDRTQELELPLFPGYVFCRFGQDERARIRATPGVFDIVRFGREPAPVDPEEMASLQQLMSSGLAAEPWPSLGVGQLVEIEEGPLRGCRGVVVEVKKRLRLVLSVTLLNRAVLVELEREWVRKLSSHSTVKISS